MSFFKDLAVLNKKQFSFIITIGQFCSMLQFEFNLNLYIKKMYHIVQVKFEEVQLIEKNYSTHTMAAICFLFPVSITMIEHILIRNIKIRLKIFYLDMDLLKFKKKNELKSRVCF